MILSEDDRYLVSHPESTLFAYFTASPNKSVLKNHRELRQWTLDETLREDSARENGGNYYAPTAFQALASEYVVERAETAALRASLSDAQAQLHAVRDGTHSSLARFLVSRQWFRRLRALRSTSHAETTLRHWLSARRSTSGGYAGGQGSTL